jgi:hypothetical protein
MLYIEVLPSVLIVGLIIAGADLIYVTLVTFWLIRELAKKLSGESKL